MLEEGNVIWKASAFLGAFQALWRIVSSQFHKQAILVSEQVQQNRIDICEVCEFFERDSRQCSRCYCFVDLKSGLATEKCPAGFWAKIDARREKS